MESVPTTSEVVAQAAVPEELRATAMQPGMVVLPEVKVTVPVGVGGPAGAIVAVKVTVAPAAEGFGLDTSDVVETSWFTTCDNAALVLVR